MIPFPVTLRSGGAFLFVFFLFKIFSFRACFMDFCKIEWHIFLAKTVFGKLQFVQVKHYFFCFLIKLSIDCLSHSAMLSSVCLSCCAV